MRIHSRDCSTILIVQQSECAHPNVRGMCTPHPNHIDLLTINAGLMVGITQQMIGVGFIVSTWVGYGSAQVPKTSSFSWRFPLAFQTIPCVIIILGLLFFPESPRQLIEKGKEDEGMRVVSYPCMCPLDPADTYHSYSASTLMVEMASGAKTNLMRLKPPLLPNERSQSQVGNLCSLSSRGVPV
jgi:MFS family permease